MGADLDHGVKGLADAVRPGDQQHGLEPLVLRVGHRDHVADDQGVALLFQLAHGLRRGAPGVDDEDVVLGVENVADHPGGAGDVLVGDQRHLALVVLHQTDHVQKVVVGDGDIKHRLGGHLLNLYLGAAPGEDGVEVLPLVPLGHRGPGLDVPHLHGEVDVVPLPGHADHGVFQGFVGRNAQNAYFSVQHSLGTTLTCFRFEHFIIIIQYFQAGRKNCFKFEREREGCLLRNG